MEGMGGSDSLVASTHRRSLAASEFKPRRYRFSLVPVVCLSIFLGPWKRKGQRKGGQWTGGAAADERNFGKSLVFVHSNAAASPGDIMDFFLRRLSDHKRPGKPRGDFLSRFLHRHRQPHVFIPSK